MNIGIIGAGAMAQAITQHAILAGHSVMLSNSRGPRSITSLTHNLKCLVGTVIQAIEFGDIIIIAIPLFRYTSLPQVPLAGKVVLDLLNYFPQRDGDIPSLQREETTTSELLAKHLPQSHLVKAFNSITVEDLIRDSRPDKSEERRAIAIAGDNIEAKEIATCFISEIGFDVVDAGPLSESWRFERFRPVYCVSLSQSRLKQVLTSTTRNTKVPDGYWLYNREALV